MSETTKHSRPTRRQFLAGAGVLAASTALYGFGPGRHHLTLLRQDVVIPDLPASFEGFRIAQLSDFHFGKFAEHDIVQHAVDIVNSLQPEMVALTGDFVTADQHNNRNNLTSATECAEILRQLKAPLRYCSFGNHDTIDIAGIKSVLESHGLPVLRNAHTAVDLRGDRLWLCGLADCMFDNPDPEATLPKDTQHPAILLGHEPDYVDFVTAFCQSQSRRCDLYLAGHTHGGQISIPGLTHAVLPTLGRNYIHGAYQRAGTMLYVNRGLGTIHLPIRLNAPPEVTLFTLRRKV